MVPEEAPLDAVAFRATLCAESPPENLTAPLRVLWHAARDEWDQAHDLANDLATPLGSWLHAYLHRVEGDLANAGYWYARAGRAAETGPLGDEWELLLDVATGSDPDGAMRSP